MINPLILKDMLVDKFANQTFHASVNDIFINALPFNKEEISLEGMQKLTAYSKKFIERLGGAGAVCENMLANDTVSDFSSLSKIMGNCIAVATEAADRIVKKSNLKDGILGDIVDNASFTKDELEKFKKGTTKVNVKDIVEGIHNKTLEVLQNEKKAYQEEDELNNKLKKMINGDDSALESYCKTVLPADLPRKHVSLFSKLNDTYLENAKYIKDHTDGIPFGLLDMVTFEGSLNMFKYLNDSFDEAMESASNVVIEAPPENNVIGVGTPSDVNNADKKAEKVGEHTPTEYAFACTMIQYVLLETLSTLDIATPTQKNIKAFANSLPRDLKDAMYHYIWTFVTPLRNEIEKVANSKAESYSKIVNDLLAIENKVNNIPDINDETKKVKTDIKNIIAEKISVFEKTPIKGRTPINNSKLTIEQKNALDSAASVLRRVITHNNSNASGNIKKVNLHVKDGYNDMLCPVGIEYFDGDNKLIGTEVHTFTFNTLWNSVVSQLVAAYDTISKEPSFQINIYAPSKKKVILTK